jgi:hypothetical protein
MLAHRTSPSRSVSSDLERLLPLPEPRGVGRVPVPTRTETESVSCFALSTMSIAAISAIGQRSMSADMLGVPIATSPAGEVVGRGGVEPPTSRLSGVRSNHLSYRPSGPVQADRALVIARVLVEPTGIEPVTSCLQSTRSPS